MGSQWGYDKVHLRAKHEGYRSRAAYKLLEIQHKFAIIRPDDNIVDLGAAPEAGSRLSVRSPRQKLLASISIRLLTLMALRQ